ncbi:MAG: hypothetical protein KDB65_02280 [Calditrichaeota bacterium]|nr:hypothetical protein [Calditrichota bacterium]MCB9368049.1 hypothetical protein [Calditrichota bacterium]
MDILLQNRLDFYQFLLLRIPDQSLRTKLKDISESSDVQIAPCPVDSNILELHKLNLVDAFKKPQFGERWGKTTLSVQEALERAIHLEEWCVLGATLVTSETGVQLFNISTFRLAKLRDLENSLRYHRLRLVEST